MDEDGIYNERGNALEFTNITATANATFTTSQDTMAIYVFIKNKGDRYIIPYINLTYDTTHLGVTQTAYFFDKSAGNIDPVELKASGTSATNLISNVNSATKSEFPVNSYIDNLDTYMLVLDFAVASSPGASFSTNFSLNIAFMADVQYDMDNEHLLTVSQPINQSSPEWTKVGYNANLTAQATKIETNSMTTLVNLDNNRDANGNVTGAVLDDYVDAIVYKDIDIVNINIATGEIIGKLSDINYDFEWYGGAVTLPSGTTLASGRVLTKSETFTVDCYTYYPTMYLRRWMVGNIQYITLSDQFFPGSTKIDAYYTATFESTIFNPDKTVATNSLGAIIPRSYSYWWTPISGGAVSHLQTYYNFGTLSGSTLTIKMANYLAWTTNMTTAWQNYLAENPSMSTYINASGVQGENYHAFIQPLLYTIKYANNNSQSMVGRGNAHTYSAYYTDGITVDTPSGTTITTGGKWDLGHLEAQKGGAVIGLRGTAGNSAGQSLTYNRAGMAYAYECSTPLYMHDFLTYTSNEKRVLLDGYIGSDGYTSLHCLGTANAWGNTWQTICGTAVVYDETTNLTYGYINFDNYDSISNNYIMSSETLDFDERDNLYKSYGYQRLNYTLPSGDGWFTHMSVPVVDGNNGLISLVALPAASTSKVDQDTGVCDYYYGKNAAGVFVMSYGGATEVGYSAGIYSYDNELSIAAQSVHLSFRSMLITK